MLSELKTAYELERIIKKRLQKAYKEVKRVSGKSAKYALPPKDCHYEERNTGLFVILRNGVTKNPISKTDKDAPAHIH